MAKHKLSQFIEEKKLKKEYKDYEVSSNPSKMLGRRKTYRSFGYSC